MATRPHLSQIQSSVPKYNNLLEEILDINSNVDTLKELSTNAIVDTYNDLENLENKEIGFYIVRNDETYKNNPTHYFYNGSNFKMVGGRLPEGLFKKTVVFYMKRFNKVGQKMKLYIPYKGYINNVTICTLEDSELEFKLYSGEELIDEFNVNGSFMGWDVYHEVDSPVLTLEMVGGEVGTENINVNVDVAIE